MQKPLFTFLKITLFSFSHRQRYLCAVDAIAQNSLCEPNHRIKACVFPNLIFGWLSPSDRPCHSTQSGKELILPTICERINLETKAS
jgi:hypothetical protein